LPQTWWSPGCKICACIRRPAWWIRNPGRTRLYSLEDIERLRQIAALLDEGLNLAGIAMVLRLEADNARLLREVSTERDRRRRG